MQVYRFRPRVQYDLLTKWVVNLPKGLSKGLSTQVLDNLGVKYLYVWSQIVYQSGTWTL